MATIMYPTLTKSQSMRSKRKSAVELLAESKSFYVKSELVRETTQVLPMRPTSTYASYRTYHRSKSVNVATHIPNCKPPSNATMLPQYMAVSPSRSLPPITHRRSVHSATHVDNNDRLQTRLRQLLVCGDSAEELSVDEVAPLSPPAEYAAQRCHKSLPDLHCREASSSNKSSNKSLSNRDSGGSSGHYTQKSEPPPPTRQEIRRDSGSSTQHSGGSSYYCCQEPECCRQPQLLQQRPGQAAYGQPPPPPCTNNSAVFKRQKCLRYKQRDKPILRSKSDISDRYCWRPVPSPVQTGVVDSTHSTSAVQNLHQFFEHLGLTSDSYEEMLSTSGSSTSPVFFSDVSTVDSSRAVDNVDNCPPQGAAYRSNDPPSIVERNARIIKWLCNCRKMQQTQQIAS
nr:unnamed protein product [Callosobruchus analis]